MGIIVKDVRSFEVMKDKKHINFSLAAFKDSENPALWRGFLWLIKYAKMDLTMG